MHDKLIPLSPMNPNSIVNAELLTKHDLLSLHNKYSIFWGGHRFTAYFVDNQEFPIELTDPRGDPNKLDKITISSHREYFEVAKQACDDACKYFSI
jgi:hypothetical protein